jgi:hypothetical protein
MKDRFWREKRLYHTEMRSAKDTEQSEQRSYRLLAHPSATRIIMA